MENEKKFKQGLVISLGVLAILGVAALTIYRAEKADRTANMKNSIATDLGEATYASLSGPQLKEKIKNEQVQMIDIRSNAEYGLEHILDSINIPLEDLVSSSEIDSTKDLVVLGLESENAIKTASRILGERGIKKMYLLEGGFVDWKAIGERTVTWGDLASFQDQAKVTFVTLDDFRNIIENKAPAVIVDARRNIFYQEGHIEGAINIPLSDIEKRRNEITSTKNVIIYSDDELESFQAAVKLYDMKLLSAGVVQGGLGAWKNKNYPVVK